MQLYILYPAEFNLNSEADFYYDTQDSTSTMALYALIAVSFDGSIISHTEAALTP